ncbi:AAA family ATPase [Candidatus Amarolinea dominans]|uniref:AAA family ATPase n=1 Tax=Candidatus Amarolinea dominans TaxID=3140696 RepID=UPI0031CCCB74
MLIGEPGVGKTAIVEGLAQKIATDEVPEILMGGACFRLTWAPWWPGLVFAASSRERLKATIEEVQRAEGEIILFIDEIHTVGCGRRVRCDGCQQHDEAGPGSR